MIRRRVGSESTSKAGPGPITGMSYVQTYISLKTYVGVTRFFGSSPAPEGSTVRRSKSQAPPPRACTNVQSSAPEIYLPAGNWDQRMPLQRLTYGFTTKLPVSRALAYLWATDYRPDDLKLGGLRATRKVERLTQDLILLTDSFDADPFNSRPGARTVKVKLVHLYPDRWSWTSTHLAGPAQHSQFLYELTTRGTNACTLHFTGSQVERVARSPTASSLERRTRELKREDSRLWERFAAQLAKDHS